MLGMILRRLAQLPIMLGVIFGLTFLMVWVVPGNPLTNPQGKRPPPAVMEAMRKQYDLQSPWAFAGGYLKGVFLGSNRSGRYIWPDFGPSLAYPDQRVTGIIAQGLPVSAMLGAAALGIAVLLGTAAGVIGALRPGSALDLSSLAVALVGVSLPNFVTGSILLVLFAAMVPLLPFGQWGTPAQVVLPAVTLGLAPAAYIARLVRLGLADVMASDYIRTARAKGLSHRRALFRHGLKVACLPVLSFLGPAAAATMTGSFVVEKVFNIPGLGGHFVQAVLNKDQFLILGIVLVYATMLIGFNLLVDLAYIWVDPRIEV